MMGTKERAPDLGFVRELVHDYAQTGQSSVDPWSASNCN